MDSAKKAIKEKIDSLTIEEAREFVATYHGAKGSEYHDFAEDCLASKEAALRDIRDSESLTISRKALQAAEEANRLASEANVSAREANAIARDEAASAARSARWAKYAAIIAAATAVVALRVDSIWSIKYLLSKIVKTS
jgi:hypothetical protein